MDNGIMKAISGIKSDINWIKTGLLDASDKIEILEIDIELIEIQREKIAYEKEFMEKCLRDDVDNVDNVDYIDNDVDEDLLKIGLGEKAYAEHVAEHKAFEAEHKAFEAERKEFRESTIKEYFEEFEPFLPECDLLEEELHNMIYELSGGRKGRKKGDEVTSSNFSESAIKQAGEEGEQKVEYVLKWLKPAGYKTISRDCHSKYSNSCILLRNTSFIDEIQEFDHIVIGKAGIFLIETKNYAGTIYVTNYGDWIQTKNGERKGIKNPVQQCDRHSALMKSIIGNVPIISIICIANDGVIIENRENCALPIVNVSMLQRFIENAETRSPLTEYQINEIVRKIEQYKVHSYGI